MRNRLFDIMILAFAISLVFQGVVFSQIESKETPSGKTEKYVNGFKVVFGERPPIDLAKIPTDAYEQGKMYIKLREQEGKKLAIRDFKSNNGKSVSTGIDEIDKLNKKFEVTTFKSSLNELYLNDFNSKSNRSRHEAWGFDLWYEVHFDKGKSVKQAVAEYATLGSIEIAEPIYIKQRIEPVDVKPYVKSSTAGQSNTNDPYYAPYQWGFNNTGQTIGSVPGTVGLDIKLEDAWQIETGNTNVIVSIHDGGVDIGHPDLSTNLWLGIGPQGYATLGDDHGTHVAGTIAAISNNGIGVAGIAGGHGTNKGVSIMSIDIFNGELSTKNGYIYASDRGSSISQNSWGYKTANAYNTPDLEGIDYFVANGGGAALSGGGIVIFAAGNDNDNGLRYPGYYSSTFSVASHTNQGYKSSFSNYGNWVEISAPGSNILSTIVKKPENTGYGWMSGTSMACPHVSGVAALVVSKYYGNITLNQLKTALLEGVDDIYNTNPSYNGQLGSGRTNAYKALLVAEKRYFPKVSTNNILNVYQSTGSCTATVIRDGGYTVTERGIVWSTIQNPTLEQNQGKSSSGGGIGDFIASLNGLALNTKYYVKAYAINSQGVSYGNEVEFISATTILINVVDQNRNPLSNVNITMGSQSLNTNSSGQVYFYRQYGTYRYKAIANSYLNTSGSVTVNQAGATLYLKLINESSDFPRVVGESNVCSGADVIYSLSNPPAGVWQVDGGFVISSLSSSSILVNWGINSSFGSVEYRMVDENNYQSTIELEVSINQNIRLTYFDKPIVHSKGSLPIFICTTPSSSYQWFKDGLKLEGKTEQHYSPRNQPGRYHVQIIDNNQCPNSSNENYTGFFSANDGVIATYPNPANANFTVSFESESMGEGNLIIANTQGEILYQEKFIKTDLVFEKQFESSILKQGIYIVRVTIDKKNPVSSRFTIY